MVKGYSSESDESGNKWRWDGRAWWHKVECKGSLNSRLRRRVSRAVSVALEQDSRKWRKGFDPITGQGLIGCKEADKARRGPVVLLGVFRGTGLFSSDDWDSQDWERPFM